MAEPDTEPDQDRAEQPPASGGWSSVAREVAALAGVAIGLIAVARSNYLLFHSLAETAIAVLALATFAFAWSSRRLENGYVLFLGLTFGFVGIFEVLHLLAYKGMGVFLGAGADLPTQLWIASRYLLSVSMAVAPWFFTRAVPRSRVILALAAVTAAALGLIFSGHFPTCYAEGSGLTPFKIASEYVICALLISGMAFLYARRQHLDGRVLRLLCGSLGVMIASELLFTSYLGVFDAANLAGHLLALAAGYLFFKAVLETGIQEPLRLLFLKLHRALESQRLLSAELTQAVGHRESFLSIAAHELRTPLTALQLQLQLLERTGRAGTIDPARVAATTAKSMRQVERLSELIDDLLDASRIQNGRMTYAFEPMSLNRLAHEVVDRFREQLEAAGISVRYCEDAQVAGDWDASRLEQVLVNLLTNAIKYAPGAPVEVRVGSDPRGATLVVRDHGQGIAEAEQAKVFRQFERASTSRGARGLGLGLFLVDQIVQAHGGKVVLESRAGQGARFTVVLPLRAGPARMTGAGTAATSNQATLRDA